MTYLWKIADNYPEKLIGEYDSTNELDRFAFKKGTYIDYGKNELKFNFEVKIEDLNRLDDLASNIMIPIVSNRLAVFLENLIPNNIQLINTTLSCVDGVLSGYKLLNVTKKISCLDKEVSEFTYIPGTKKIMKISKAIYKENCLDNYDLARDEDYSSNLLVSNSLVNLMMKNKFIVLGLY